MSMAKLTCRLCMNTESIRSLTEMDGDKGIVKKIKFCISVEINSEDGMPALVCKSCIKEIKRFYRFKQKCLRVDQEFRSMRNHSNVDNDLCKSNTDITLNSYLATKDAIGLHRTSNINIENNKNEISTEENQVEPDKPCTHDIVIANNEKTAQSSIDHEPFTVQCEVCGCVFETKTAFRKHLSSHSGIIKAFQCDLCPKRFTRAENSIIHMQSHMGIKPFICEICGQSATKRQDLIRHMKIHSDERSHACQNCGRCFKRSFDLYRHMHTHTGVRPYKCRLCEKDYTSHSGLRKHYKTHGKIESDIG